MPLETRGLPFSCASPVQPEQPVQPDPVRFLNSIVSTTPSNRHSDIIPRLSGFDVFLQNFTHSSNHAPSLIINAVTRAVGDDHAWDTLLASGAIRHIHRRSPRRVCCTSTQATLRDLALYVSCGTSFHSCNQAFRHVDYLLLTTCSATMFAVYLLSDPNGPPAAFLLFKPQCTVGVLAGTHWSALRCPGRMASGTKRQTLICCTAAAPLSLY